MSLILEGIDLPKKNAKDYIVISWYETNTHGGLDLKSKFVECVDIVQIPKGHGRIIDENEAVKGWCEGCAFKDTEECADCKDKEMCKYAPTLLEREEKECINHQ